MGSLKESRLYRDIYWLMEKIDCVSVLERLGIKVAYKVGDELVCLCPDHRQFTGHDPSHPKWSVNIKSGKTQCWTEGRGSNFLWTIARLRNCTAKEAVDWMLGVEVELSAVTIQNMKSDFEKLKKTNKEGKCEKTVKWLHDIKNYLDVGMGEDGYEYFMRPPGKKPTLILKDTVDYYCCAQVTSGFYVNRVIVPFKQKNDFVGYEAVDILGEEKWLKNHPGKMKDDYKKILYPKGFNRKSCLFGYDDVKKGSVVIVTEGAREVMKLRQLGFMAVAILGSSMSSEQVMLLAEVNPSVVMLMFDGDDVGYAITTKIYEQIKEFFTVAKAVVPRGCDPKTLDLERFKVVYDRALGRMKKV